MSDESRQEIEKVKSDFIAMVSHELRTPMTIIKEATNLLLTKKLPKDKQQKYLHMIQKHVDRLNMLISDLLDLSKIEGHHLMLMREPVDFGNMAEELVRQLEPLVNEKHLIFIHEVMPDLPIVVGDKRRINQVILNLVGNAVKYTPRGGQIKLQILRETDSIIIKIIDTGRGLTPDQLSRVFEEFYVVDEVMTRASGGAGLGLPVARGLVEAMGGSIWGESAGVGQGSTFGFSLPLAGKGDDPGEEQDIAGG